ncbi:hypothetical protein D3C87_665330 [compost metagenome]
METQIRYVTGRTARARIRGGQLIVTVPRHWPRTEIESTLAKFKRWAQKQALSLHQLPPPDATTPVSLETLVETVARINRETLNVTYHGVRIGRSRYTRLAQVNLKTRILTFSRYAIDGLPERALRYLILHELAHLIVPNHSAKFWAVVERYEPDYRNQRQIAQNHYQRMAAASETPAPTLLDPLPPMPTAERSLLADPSALAAPSRPAKPKGRGNARPVQLSLF